MQIAVLGSGAMGLSFGSLLIKAGENVVFFDEWSDNIKAVTEHGVILDDVDEKLSLKAKMCTPSSFEGKIELLIVFCKSASLPHMMDSVKKSLTEGTTVLCLMNGLGHPKTLENYVDSSRIVMGVTVVTASMKGAGHAALSGHGKTEVMSLTPSGADKAKMIADLLSRATLPTAVSDNIMFSIWRKACLNGCLNSLCTVLECNMLNLGKQEGTKENFKQIVSEFSLVAAKEGVSINADEVTDYVFAVTQPSFKGASHFPSMYQDLIINKRKTEIDFLNGYVSREGAKYGIPTPYCTLITRLVKAKEGLLGAK